LAAHFGCIGEKSCPMDSNSNRRRNWCRPPRLLKSSSRQVRPAQPCRPRRSIQSPWPISANSKSREPRRRRTRIASLIWRSRCVK
jgi:hypothetical protein